MNSSIDSSVHVHAASSEPLEIAWLISAEKLAQLLEISVRTLWRLRSAGKLPLPIRVGGCIRWRTQDVRAWIEAGCPNLKQHRR